MQIDSIDTIFHGVQIWVKSQILCLGDTSDGIPDSASVAIGNRNKTNPRGVRGFGFGVRILSDPGKTLHRSSADPTILT